LPHRRQGRDPRNLAQGQSAGPCRRSAGRGQGALSLVNSTDLGAKPEAPGGTAMQPRLNPYRAAPQAMKALAAIHDYLDTSGLERSLIELVKIRTSQINGCAYCIHTHTRQARERGETEERIYLLDAWRDSPLYTPRERAALAWAEAVTLVAETHVPDAVFE